MKKRKILKLIAALLSATAATINFVALTFISIKAMLIAIIGASFTGLAFAMFAEYLEDDNK